MIRCSSKRISSVLAFATLSILASVHNATAVEKTLFTALKTDVAPVIDGNLDDNAWQNAAEVAEFTQITAGNPATHFPTKVRALYDAQNLYLSFRATQKSDTLKATAKPEGELWNDDSIELFIQPLIIDARLLAPPPQDRHYHLIFNSAGVRFDQLGSMGGTSWDGAWEVKTKIYPNEWDAEVKIPLRILYDTGHGLPPYTGWNVQVARTIPSAAELTTLFPAMGVYRKHEAFGNLVFVSQVQDSASIYWNLDRQKEFTPRLDRLRATLAQAAQAAPRSLLPSISAQQTTVEGVWQKFNSIEPARYEAAVRLEILQSLRITERQTRALQESMVKQRATELRQSIALAPHPAVKDSLLVNADFLPAYPDIGRPVKVAVTPGEYAASSFVLWTDKVRKNISVNLSELEKPECGGKAKRLLPDAVDVRWVKRWYQSGSQDLIHEGKILVPELLLKNPELVQVDTAKQENILLDYRPADGSASDYLERSYPGDALTLQSLPEAPAQTATQVWLTINVPTGTTAGLYRGTINVRSGKEIIGRLPIEIRVLDFELAPSLLEHNWYTTSLWGDNQAKWQNPERSLAEIQNMARHGVDRVALVERPQDLGRAVELMKKGGLKTDRLFMNSEGGSSNFNIDMGLEKAIEQAKVWVEAAKKAGAQEIYLYLEDEATGERLRSQRPLADAIHKTGAKTWVACNSEYFEYAGDFLDAPVVASWLKPELAEKVHGIGRKIYSYANPQGGIERPEIYRRNYGLLLWQDNYDGAFNWGWYQTFGSDFATRNPWYDFSDTYYRQHCMVYPTKTGVVDTIQWEGWREGVNDCRYLATLLREIRTAKAEARNSTAVNAAELWLKALKSGGAGALNDLDLVRSEMIRHIQACRIQGK